ncbi:helix-turn-helix transcriptional regulator [Bordetella hinzii]|uniref:helix-turn-helix transcriptional regulator n=1 Tax=Bordetella hinzii TaxID=103855 RepID=UPI0039FC4E88
MNTAFASPTKSLSIRDVVERVGVCRQSVYDLLNPKSPRHDPAFPRPFKIGMRTFFVESEVEGWLQEKIAACRVTTSI